MARSRTPRGADSEGSRSVCRTNVDQPRRSCPRGGRAHAAHRGAGRIDARKTPKNKRRKRAVEMTGLWKPWKAKSRLPPVSTGPWKSRQGQARFPHFHSSGGKQADGKVENQKQVSHFPTATNPFSRNQNRATGGLRPPPCAASLRPASANDVYHSVTLSGEATR
jgi:hypothetical protein